MTPNLRYNKKITSRIINASPNKENRMSLLNINWGLDNNNSVYGLKFKKWFRTSAVFLQREDETHFRLIVPGKGLLCNFYIIDNIEEFLDFIGIEKLDMAEPEKIREAIDQTKDVPNTGIITIEDGAIYVYDHSNY